MPESERDRSLNENINSFVLLAFMLGYEAGIKGAAIPEDENRIQIPTP